MHGLTYCNEIAMIAEWHPAPWATKGKKWQFLLLFTATLLNIREEAVGQMSTTAPPFLLCSHLQTKVLVAQE
jgi:hypothetical protein